MAYKVTGVITHIGEVEEISANFSKQLVVVEVANGEYPEIHPIEFQNAKIGLVADLAEGQEVTVHFNIKGREWAGQTPRKFFTTLSAWKVEGAQAPAPVAPKQVAKKAVAPAMVSNTPAVAEDDELPF